MKKSTTRRALFLSCVSLFLCFTMLVGTTYAWFTDSVNSGVNTIVSGNLDVELEYYNTTDGEYKSIAGATDLFGGAKWEPGHAEVVYLKLSNEGDLAFTYSAAVSVISEVIGKTMPAAGSNAAGKDIRLSKYLNFAVVNGIDYANKFATREAAIDAAIQAGANSLWVEKINPNTGEDEGNYTSAVCFAGKMEANDPEKYFAIVVWMPTTVGNEANHDGVSIPSIDLAIGVFATQVESESDSFDNTYDKDAKGDAPAHGTGTYPINRSVNAVAYPLEARDPSDNSKVASADVDADAVADNVEKLELTVTEEDVPDGFTVAVDGKKTKTYNVVFTGYDANGNVVPAFKDQANLDPSKVKLRMEPGLDPDTVKLYHETETTPIATAVYDPHTGYVAFTSNDFSPFTVVYDPDEKYVPTAPNLPDGIPVADVDYASEYVNTDLEWGSYGQWSPTAGLDSKLEAAFIFKCPEDTSTENLYDNWYCDFYVKLDKALGENQIFLGGNYGSFGWVGFHNGDIKLAADQEIGLLESVTTNPWTYADVKTFVGEFTCGVGDVNNALEGAKFTVMLRLTNPENENEFYNVNVVTHTFGGTPVIDGETVVTTGEQLQDAVNNGDTNIQLGGDIDLGQGGLVIPGLN